MGESKGADKLLRNNGAIQTTQRSPQNNTRVYIWSLAFLVSFITFLVYLPALRNGFVYWDDPLYVYENQNIRFINLNFLKWSFTAVVAALWHPLTMVSLGLDYAIWGLNPWGFHLTNILFHTLNTTLIFTLAIRLIKYETPGKHEESKTLIAGFITALLFGIHPLHVESVAWVSERKDVLSTFFFLLSLLAYIKYNSTVPKKRLFYSACLILFILALMSKPMAVSLPLVFLMLDFYPLNRLTMRDKNVLILKNFKKILIEKLPFFLLASLTSLVTIWAHQVDGTLGTLEKYPLITRILVAGCSYVFYLAKMLLPFNLAPLYPYPIFLNFFTFEYAGSFILFVLVTFFAIYNINKKRLFASIWAYYIITLVPVIGIIQVGMQVAADRYTYLPSIGPLLLLGLAIATIFENCSNKGRLAIIAITILLSGTMVSRTLRQIPIWHDSITLWSYEIKLYPDSYAAHYNLGNFYKSQDQLGLAAQEYRTAIELKPDYVEAHNNLGGICIMQGRLNEAINEFQTAIKLRPNHPSAHNNLGTAYRLQGKLDEAIREYQEAVRLKPDFAKAYNNLEKAYALKAGTTAQTEKLLPGFSEETLVSP